MTALLCPSDTDLIAADPMSTIAVCKEDLFFLKMGSRLSVRILMHPLVGRYCLYCIRQAHHNELPLRQCTFTYDYTLDDAQ